MRARPRYVVRSVGSFLAAAALATLGVLGSTPAVAASAVTPVVHTRIAGLAAVAASQRRELERASDRQVRLAGVWDDLNGAIARGEITLAQAQHFANQVAVRIDRGF